MTAPKYGEGDWFAVPLAGGDFAVGVVARARKGVVLGYFFGPRRTTVAALGDLADLRPTDAVLVGTISCRGLRIGKWPIIGRAANWDRDTWPMPVFVRTEEVSDRSFRVYYDPDDPSRRLRDERVPPGAAAQGPQDGLMGDGYVEEVLSLLLG